VLIAYRLAFTVARTMTAAFVAEAAFSEKFFKR
jgi:hypothetical protein